MCLAKIVFAVFAWTTVTNYVFVSGQENEEVPEPPEEKTDPPPVENHTFVALIDIVFVDGKKRQCTGTIIHDYVVVTAAHCFLSPKYADIELSGSFVVIGTKKMFDSGYENYIPIERIVTHPRYQGWTADLALVFTFAAMTTDKPGHAMPLVGEGATTPVDSNVTILSWGRCADGDEKDSCEPATTYKPLRQGSRSSEKERSSEEARSQHRSARVTYAHNAHRVLGINNVQKVSQDHFLDVPNKSNEPHEPLEPPLDEASSQIRSARVTYAHNAHRVLGINNAQKVSQDVPNKSNEPHEPLEPPLNVSIGMDNQTISIDSSHLEIAEAKLKKKENLTKALRQHQTHDKSSRSFSIVNVKDQKWPKDQMLVERRGGHNTSLVEETAIHSYKKNWRRQDKPLSTKENTLTVETFGFVNVQTCKKLVDKVLPVLYGINTNEVVCYAADEHYISDDDSGAPATRQGHLVAVTVGGVECDGDHVAIGMKMNCFCSWIAENLPAGGTSLECCTDCCGETLDHT